MPKSGVVIHLAWTHAKGVVAGVTVVSFLKSSQGPNKYELHIVSAAQEAQRRLFTEAFNIKAFFLFPQQSELGLKLKVSIIKCCLEPQNQICSYVTRH